MADDPAGLVPSERTTAVALGYDQQKDDAPRVLAVGRGEIAERIIALAKEAGVTLRSDPALVKTLSKLDVGSSIPPELYQVIAEVLAFVFMADQRMAERRGMR